MKKNISINIIQWIVGLLFIFSGLIKANDPLGLSYKMQEFFEAWNLQSFDSYSLAFALMMNVFEVLAGVAVIVGWQMRLFSWLLLLLIIFFCFLTGYAFLSGKIKTCGCFGDCLPLTPLQSFIKDVILLLLIIVLFVNNKNIKPIFLKNSISSTILFIVIIAVSSLQFYVLKYLPLLDCLPYKIGNNIVKEMSVPMNAVTDSFALTFRYKKDGKIFEFDAEHIPENLDSSYEFVDRYDKLVRKGNNVPLIADFNLRKINGDDTTAAILSQKKFYVLMFVQNFNDWNNQKTEFQKIIEMCRQKNMPLFVVTSDPNNAKNIYAENNILRCDATVIKTAARVNATYFLMQQANILAKKSYADADEFINKINSIKMQQ